MAAKLITVRSTIPTRPDGGNVIALYEIHEDHPDGEAFVAGPGPVKVARTGTVHRLISDGTLEEVGAKKPDDSEDDEEDAAPQARAPRRRAAPAEEPAASGEPAENPPGV